MLDDLAKPDAGGRWLLPNLEIIILDDVRKKLCQKFLHSV